MYPWGLFAVLFAVSLVAVLLTTPIARKIAERVGAIDYPNARRINTEPTPRMGGIAIFIGIAAGMLVQQILTPVFGWPSPDEVTSQLHVNHFMLMAAFAVIFTVGLLDDRYHLRPLVKFAGQVVAAVIAAAGGLVIGSVVNPFARGFIQLGWIDYPITVIYLIAFANIINLIDGLDGLASGIACISSLTFFLLSIPAGRIGAASLAIMIAGCTLGFLRYNFYPARIFLGDSGSLLIGFALGTVSLMSVTRVAGLTTIILPIVIAGVPIVDTFFAIMRRARAHVSIGHADKGHIHHRLIEAGFDQRQAVVLMYAWTAALCVGSLVMNQVQLVWRIVIFVLLVVASIIFAIKLKLFNPVLLHREDPETGEDEIMTPDDPGYEQARREFDEAHGKMRNGR